MLIYLILSNDIFVGNWRNTTVVGFVFLLELKELFAPCQRVK